MVSRLTTSVIIPVYNESTYIEGVLTALHMQTLQPDEIIVVDNNSTDDTTEKVSKFAGVKVIHEMQQGNVYGRNSGFDAATGDVLFKLDADSRPDPEWLAACMNALTMRKVSAISGKIYVYDGSFKSIVTPFTNFFIFTVNRVLLLHPMLFGSNYGLTKEAWHDVRVSTHASQSIWEDVDISIQLTKHHHTIGRVSSPLMGVSTRSSFVGIRRAGQILSEWSRTLRINKRYVASVLVYVPITLIMILHICGRALAHRGFTPSRSERH